MNILKEDFCVVIESSADRTLYSMKAGDIFNKYEDRYADADKPIQYDYYDMSNSNYVGYRDGSADNSNTPWDPMISVELYADLVDQVIDGIIIEKIDNYSII